MTPRVLLKSYYVFPRVNDRESGHLLKDIQALTIEGVHGFMYPKSKRGEDIYFFDKLLETIEYEKKIPIGTYKIIPLIIDFSEEATDKFYDKEWDGLPENETEGEPQPPKQSPKPGKPKGEGEGDGTLGDPPGGYTRPEKIVVELSNGRKLKVVDIETRYIDESGIPLTAKQFLEKLIGFIPDLYATEEELRRLWTKPETREELLLKLAGCGIDEEQLDSLKELFEAENSDIFDILLHISFAGDIITRHERADYTLRDEAFFTTYQNLKAQEFLRFVLQRYEVDGINELKREKLAHLVELNRLGTTKEAAKVFGGINHLIDAFYKLQEHLYAV